MFARITSIQIDPAKLGEMRAALPPIAAKLKVVPGMVECKVCWDESGKGQVFALYERQSQADAASETIRNLWGGLAHLLTAPPASSTGTEVFDLLS